MSNESLEWLRTNVLVGFTEMRGTAWHHRKDDDNHFLGAIPEDVVIGRLFNWDPVVREVMFNASLSATDWKLVETKKALVRSDTRTLLGIVGSDYQVHPYRSTLVHAVSGALGDVGIATAGLLRGGAVAWVQVELPENRVAPTGIDHRPFLLATTSLDGSASTQYLTGTQVVVCDNTLSAALREKDVPRVRFRHVAGSDRKSLTGTDITRTLDKIAAQFDSQVTAQVATQVSDDQWQQFLLAQFPFNTASGRRIPRPTAQKRAAVHKLWCQDPRVSPWRGTAYGVLAAMNTFESHISSPALERSRQYRNALRITTRGFDAIDRRTLVVLSGVLKDSRLLRNYVAPNTAS